MRQQSRRSRLKPRRRLSVNRRCCVRVDAGCCQLPGQKTGPRSSRPLPCNRPGTKSRIEIWLSSFRFGVAQRLRWNLREILQPRAGELPAAAPQALYAVKRRAEEVAGLFSKDRRRRRSQAPLSQTLPGFNLSIGPHLCIFLRSVRCSAFLDANIAKSPQKEPRCASLFYFRF